MNRVRKKKEKGISRGRSAWKEKGRNRVPKGIDSSERGGRRTKLSKKAFLAIREQSYSNCTLFLRRGRLFLFF